MRILMPGMQSRQGDEYNEIRAPFIQFIHKIYFPSFFFLSLYTQRAFCVRLFRRVFILFLYFHSIQFTGLFCSFLFVVVFVLSV